MVLKPAAGLLSLLATWLAAGATSQDMRLEHPSLPSTEFHLFASQRADSQLAAEAFCRQRSLQTVSTREVRYFWKQLPYNISFYLGSRIEMTTDHPEIARGEVLCFPLRRINAAVQSDAVQALNWPAAGRGGSGGGNSCQAGVSSVLCKRQWARGNCTAAEQSQLLPRPDSEGDATRQRQPPKVPEQQQERGHVTFKAADGSVCMTAPLFWTLAAGTGALLLSLAAAAATLAACSVRFKRQLQNSSFGYHCLSRQASARLMMQQGSCAGAKQPGGSRVGGAALDTDDGAGFFL